MSIKIEINSCSDCPYLKLERYYYCKKKFNSDVDAYRANEYAEYQNEIKYLFNLCPFK